MSSEEPGITAPELMGIRNKGPIAAALTSGIPPLTEKTAPTTAWEIYNNRAAIVDRELIKDWNASLNTLLVFAALYSAVLTAFIIESMKIMQQDPTEMTRDILLTITKQLANQSTSAFEPPPFEVPIYATLVNACFFISIILSLIAALGAVLGLQWVGNYDFGLNSSSPKERALQRQFRYMGIEEWKMAEIIAFLPIFLFISLFLFLIGLAVWLFQIHKVISALVILGVVVAAIFYIATTIIAIRHVDAPFRTPVSKYLPVIYYASIKFLKSLPQLLFRNNQPTSGDKYSFTKREEKAIGSRPSLEMDSLLWAVKSLDILPYARDTLKVLIEAFMSLPTDQLFDSKINDAPWLPIFKMLCQPYFHKTQRDDYNEDERISGEIVFILKAMAMIGDDNFDGEEFHDIKLFLSSLSTISSVESINGISSVESINGFPIHRDIVLQTYARLILCRREDGGGIGDLLYYFVTPLVRRRVEVIRPVLDILHHLQLTRPGLFTQVEGFQRPLHDSIPPALSIFPADITTDSPLPHEILNLLLQVLATEITDPNTSIGDDPLLAYLSAYEKVQLDPSIQLRDGYHGAHRLIRTHYIAHLTRIRGNTDPSSSELAKVLNPIHDIILQTQGETRIETLRDILSVFLDSPFETKLMALKSDYTLIKVASLVFCVPAEAGFNLLTFDHNSQADWFMEMSIGCDARLNESGYGPDDQLSFLRLYCKTLDKVSPSTTRVETGEWFKSIRSPYVALLVWTVLGFEFEHPALTSFPPECWNNFFWDELAQWSFTYIPRMFQHPHPRHLQPRFIEFARAALAYGSHDTKNNCIRKLTFIAQNRVYGGIPIDDQLTELDVYNLFQAPTLQDMFNVVARDGIVDPRVTILVWISTFPRFNDEFIEANGFSWLECAISSLEVDDGFIRVITNAAPRSRSFSELAQWMNCLRECLIRTLPIDFSFLSLKIDRIESILAEQSEKRSCDSTALSEPSRYDYVRIWTESEWNNWRTYMEGLTEGMRRKSILERQPQLAMDPDGVCCRKTLQKFGRANRQLWSEDESIEEGSIGLSYCSSRMSAGSAW